MDVALATRTLLQGPHVPLCTWKGKSNKYSCCDRASEPWVQAQAGHTNGLIFVTLFVSQEDPELFRGPDKGGLKPEERGLFLIVWFWELNSRAMHMLAKVFARVFTF